MTKTEIIAEQGMPRVLVLREFAATLELLFRAHIEPELLTQWLGPRSLRVTVEEMEPRDGGRWRIVHWDAAGNGYGFHGVHHGTPSTDGIVGTYGDEAMPGAAHVYLHTITFEPRGARTLLRQNTVLQTVADRDVYARTGMEEGVKRLHDPPGRARGRAHPLNQRNAGTPASFPPSTRMARWLRRVWAYKSSLEVALPGGGRARWRRICWRPISALDTGGIGAAPRTAPFSALSEHISGSRWRVVDVEYKVLAERDSRFSGEFSAEDLERALNSYAAEGWRVVNSFAASNVWKSFKAQILVIMERETPPR